MPAAGDASDTLVAEPEPEPQLDGAAAADVPPEPELELDAVADAPPGPLDAEIVAIVSGDGEAGEMCSFRQLAERLHDSTLTGDHKVFVPPAHLNDAVQISEIMDIDELAGMEADEVVELATSLREQLMTEIEGDYSEQENTPVLGDDDDIDKACVAACPPLDLTMGCFRCPLELPEELIPQAERQLGETADARAAAIAEMRGRIEELEVGGVGKGKKRTSIVFPRKDDLFLCAFLRCKKFRVDDAVNVCIKYTQFVHEFADVLGSLDSEGEPMMDPKNQQNLGMYIVPGCTKKGGRLICFRLGEMPVEMLERIDPKIHADIMYKQSIRFMMSLFTRIISDPWATVCGVSMCEDWGDAPPFKLITRLENCLSSKQKKIVFGLFSDVLPMRLSGFYVLNQPKWFTVILAIVKPFLSKKLRKRIYLLKDDYARFHSLVDRSQLPGTFHGTKDWAPVREAEQGLCADPMKNRCTFEDLGIGNHLTCSDADPRPYDLSLAPCAVQ